MSSSDFDVAVIGAGAAGLCAAAELCRQGRSVLLLEARARLGGRIVTHVEPGLDHPIELGAEFIHGQAPLTRELLRAAGIPAVDTAGNRITRREGRVRARADEFEQVRRLMAQAASLRQDLSVEAFLAQYAADESLQPIRSFVRTMVEGFDAADPQHASVKAIAAEWAGQSIGGQARPLGGYGRLLSALSQSLDPERSRLMLETIVQAVDWGGQRVSIQARGPTGSITVSARHAIVSLPVSLLKAPDQTTLAVRFEPALTEKQAALDGLALGRVIRVVLQFRRAFWEELADGRFADAGFMHAPEATFPTLWTALPFRVPLLTAWVGGPRAQRLGGASREELIAQALVSVQQILETGDAVADELIGAHVHDWSADPYARGAYCYLTVGGHGAPAALARPLGARLFFAGEATSEDSTGTVEAALQSGRRAARAVIEATR